MQMNLLAKQRFTKRFTDLEMDFMVAGGTA